MAHESKQEPQSCSSDIFLRGAVLYKTAAILNQYEYKIWSIWFNMNVWFDTFP